MARTYTDIPEPRKVLEADTIRGYSRERVEEALSGESVRAIRTSTTAAIEGTSLMLLIPTKSHTHDELLEIVNQLVTQITIVYADLGGVSSEIIPFGNQLVIPFYAKNLFRKPEYNTGSNVYSGDILDQTVRGGFLVNNPGGGSIYNLYFEITLGS